MAETLQGKLLRLNREILALKSSQTKPASLRVFRAVAQNIAQESVHTIYYSGSDYKFAPIVANDSSVVLLPYDADSNSQQFISLYVGTANIYFSASREIDRIV